METKNMHLTEDEFSEKVEKMWQDVDKQHLDLKILMAGKTQVGKGSVINAIIGKNVALVGKGNPMNRENSELKWSTEMGDIIITDVPGFGEPNAPTIDGVSYIDNIKKLGYESHLVLLVIKCDDAALEPEKIFLSMWNDDPKLKKIPVFIVINQIDKITPVRIWEPEHMNLKHPTTEKEINIVNRIKDISKNFGLYAYNGKIFPTCAGESPTDEKYGFEELKSAINEATSDMLGLIIERQNLSRDEKALKLINRYSLAAAGSALQPIPIVDSFIIAPIQIAMIIHIGRIYHVNITKAAAGAILNALGLSFVGNYIFFNIVSFIPIIKQAVGPAIAYGLTYTSGLIIKELFLTGNLNPSKEQLNLLAQKYKTEADEAKKRYENENSKK